MKLFHLLDGGVLLHEGVRRLRMHFLERSHGSRDQALGVDGPRHAASELTVNLKAPRHIRRDSLAVGVGDDTVHLASRGVAWHVHIETNRYGTLDILVRPRGLGPLVGVVHVIRYSSPVVLEVAGRHALRAHELCLVARVVHLELCCGAVRPRAALRDGSVQVFVKHQRVTVRDFLALPNHHPLALLVDEIIHSVGVRHSRE